MVDEEKHSSSADVTAVASSTSTFPLGAASQDGPLPEHIGKAVRYVEDAPSVPEPDADEQDVTDSSNPAKRDQNHEHHRSFLSRILRLNDDAEPRGKLKRSSSKSSSSSSSNLAEPTSPSIGALSSRHSKHSIHKALTLESVRAFQEVMLKEMENEVVGSRCIIHPDRPMRLAWDLVAMFAIIYQAILVPYELAFSQSGPSGEECIYNAIVGDQTDGATCVVGALNLVVDTFFAVDIMFNFMTGFHDKGTLVLEPSKCAWNYFHTWFIIDVLGIFPWRYINPDSDSTTGAARLLRLLKFLKFVRLLKLLRVMKLRSLLIKLEDHVRSEYLFFVFQLVKLSLCLLLLCHVTACAWYGVGLIAMSLRADDDVTHISWIEAQGLQEEEGNDATHGERYITALYFTMATMTTVGYGDISAGTFPMERVFGTLTLLAGTGVFAMLLSSISSSVQQQPTGANATGADMNRAALRYLWKNGISGELTVQIRKYLQQREVAKEDVAIEQYLRESISQTLLHDLCVESFRSTVLRFDFFTELSNSTVEEICRLCARARICPGEVLFAEGDDADGMYFIVKGTVLVFKHSRKEEDPVPELSEGMYFGEACFFLDGATRHASVVGKVFCELVTISRGSFMQLAEWNDELEEAIHARTKAAKDFAQQQSISRKLLPEEESRMGTQCGLCKMLGHYPDECPIKYRFDNPRRELITAQPIPPVTPAWTVFMRWLPWGGCCPRRLTKLRDFKKLRRRRLTVFGYVNPLPPGDGPFLFVPKSEVMYQQSPHRPSRTQAFLQDAGAFLGKLAGDGVEFGKTKSARSSMTSRSSVLSRHVEDVGRDALDGNSFRRNGRSSTVAIGGEEFTPVVAQSWRGGNPLRARSSSGIQHKALERSRSKMSFAARLSSRIFGQSCAMTVLKEDQEEPQELHSFAEQHEDSSGTAGCSSSMEAALPGFTEVPATSYPLCMSSSSTDAAPSELFPSSNNNVESIP